MHQECARAIKRVKSQLSPPFLLKPFERSCSPTSSDLGALTCGSPQECLVTSTLLGKFSFWWIFTHAHSQIGRGSCAWTKRPICSHVLALPRRFLHFQDCLLVWSMSRNVLVPCICLPLLRRAQARSQLKHACVSGRSSSLLCSPSSMNSSQLQSDASSLCSITLVSIMASKLNTG